MPLFKILPTDESFPSAEIVAPDAARVLNIVERFGCKEADVLRDGEYCFSIRLGDEGPWCIFQRDYHAETKEIRRSASHPSAAAA